MIIIGIDPGTDFTGVAVVGGDYSVYRAYKMPSADVEAFVRSEKPDAISCESLSCYGVAVGREVFETAFWIGEYRCLCRQLGIPFHLFARPEYARALAGVGKVTDSVLRQTLLLRFGGDKKGQPLFPLKGSTDQRSAYAVAVYYLDKHHLTAVASR